MRKLIYCENMYFVLLISSFLIIFTAGWFQQCPFVSFLLSWLWLLFLLIPTSGWSVISCGHSHLFLLCQSVPWHELTASVIPWHWSELTMSRRKPFARHGYRSVPAPSSKDHQLGTVANVVANSASFFFLPCQGRAGQACLNIARIGKTRAYIWPLRAMPISAGSNLILSAFTP